MINRGRVVIDARYLGSMPSGIGNYVKALVSRLPHVAPDLRFRIWVNHATDVSWFVDQGTEVHRVSAAAHGLRSAILPASIDHLNPNDVFHAPSNVLGAGLCSRSVVTIHDVMWLEHPELCQPIAWRRPISQAYFGLGIRRALHKAKKIITVSNASARSIRAIDDSFGDRIVVTHNACESCFRPAHDNVAARRSAARILGFSGSFYLVVGQNQPSKGHELALRAFAGSHLSHCRLVFVQRLRVGHGLVRLARSLGVSERVRFIDKCSQQDLVTLLQAATALLQPSQDEGFGLPVLEAAACGCPVIASDLSVFRELLHEAACFVPSSSESDWCRSIMRLDSDFELQQHLRVLGRERSRSFCWDTMASDTLRVYRDVLDNE